LIKGLKTIILCWRYSKKQFKCPVAGLRFCCSCPKNGVAGWRKAKNAWKTPSHVGERVKIGEKCFRNPAKLLYMDEKFFRHIAKAFYMPASLLLIVATTFCVSISQSLSIYKDLDILN